MTGDDDGQDEFNRLVDEVASALTAAPAQPYLVGRVRDRIERRQRASWFGSAWSAPVWRTVVAGALAVAVAVVVNDRWTQVSPVPSTELPTVRTESAVRPLLEAASIGEPRAGNAATPPPRAIVAAAAGNRGDSRNAADMRALADIPFESLIVEPLEVSPLPVEAMAGPMPLDIEPLSLEPLALSEGAL